MRAKGWVPTIPFPGADKKWPGWCNRCKEPGKPRYANVCSPSSKQGPCRPCSGAQKKTEQEARAIMAVARLDPADALSEQRHACRTAGTATGDVADPVERGEGDPGGDWYR
jgi:hypothetical protein